jgi:hypothetical protein
MSIITKADVKLFLDLKTSNDDAILDKLIACAEADAASKIDCSISTVSTYTEFFDGDRVGNRLLLKYSPVTAIVAIWDDITRAFTDDTQIPATNYAIAQGGVVKLDPWIVFMRGIQNVKVQYQAGYSAIPEDYKKALIFIVMADYMGVKTRINAVADDEIGGKIKGLRAQAKDILDGFRNYGNGN